MKLECTERNLERLRTLQDPSAEDVLCFFFDFCQDIRMETGVSAESLDCRDEDLLFRRLAWTGRFYRKFSAERKGLFAHETRQERMHQLEELSGKTEAELQSIGLEREGLLEQEKLIRNRLAELDGKKQEIRQIQDECEKIEEEVQYLEATEVKDLIARKETLEQDKEAQQQTLSRLSKETAGLKESISCLNGEIGSTRAEEQKLRDTLRETELAQQRLMSGIQSLREAIEKMKHQNEVLTGELKKYETQRTEQTDRIQQTIAEKQKVQQELNSEETRIQIRNLDEIDREILSMRNRLLAIREIRERIAADWNSSWGEEMRGDTSHGILSESVLQTDLDEIHNRLDRHEEDLRILRKVLSSSEAVSCEEN